MGIDDLVNKGKEFLEKNKDKIDDAIRSERAEGISDSALDAGAAFVAKVAGEEHADKIEGFRDEADKRIGTE